MRREIQRRELDFFAHAKEVIGEMRFNKSIKKGRKRVNRLRLKAAREVMGLNQADFKSIPQPEISKIEARKDMKLSTLRKYAEAMGMKVQITFVSNDKDKKHSISIYG